MLDINGILVEKDIITKYFLCDITKCFGGCCTFPGEFGAPLTVSEVSTLESLVDDVKSTISQKSLNYIKENGTVSFSSGRPTTVCINKRDCVFVYYSDDVALCALEKEFLDEKITFRKPISCWLFPIRVGFHKELVYLYYEKIKECNDAVKNGKAKKVRIYQALKAPLIAFLGENWYEKLEEIAKGINE